MGERESGRSHTLGGREVAPQGMGTTGHWRTQSGDGASVAGRREGAITGGYKKGGDRGVREGAEGKEGNLPERESERGCGGSGRRQSAGVNVHTSIGRNGGWGRS